ncbi:Gfo/Idh/MocA family oxidoreductase [Solirubrobacter sp. CPCC 204708]|uniref:Gfo/Idh/MocA family oxidoreductase n=1 Tax=Solirubrobacter deserti TaxID=2282478 RepID=A0ABT4RJ86_9ACTN|nr:Gfo/Idh/MocA family oxidoreductase [Solirubrobacter deserti]MBE2317678.1 Gfo/Idh/MocA family oxidoreductase [Solirubrobacter deserti]MDA0138629.1 Gfo/Idh/MocA family oxidoreductase [Solirubrobacter deserti]
MLGGEVRVAIAGTGFMGAVHARSARLAGARLVGVAGSSPEKSSRAAADFGAERPFATAEELVESPDVDVVHVCTPNHLHRPLAEAALAAGKHVICEKPLAVDDRGAEEMLDAAIASGKVHAVPFVYRYHPMVREARERVRSGTSGAIRLIHGGYLQDWLLKATDDNWRVDETLGGASRAFADIGSHWCDLAEFVSGHRITRVSARTYGSFPERPTEDAVIMQFETDKGAVGSTVISQISAGRKNMLTLEIDAADEALHFNQEEPESLWVGKREAVTLLKRDPGLLSPAAARFATVPAGHPQGYPDAFNAFIADAYAATLSGEAPDGLPDFRDGLRAARITAAVLASAETETWVDVPSAAALTAETADV